MEPQRIAAVNNRSFFPTAPRKMNYAQAAKLPPNFNPQEEEKWIYLGRKNYGPKAKILLNDPKIVQAASIILPHQEESTPTMPTYSNSDVYEFNKKIEAARDEGNAEKALELLDEMRANGLSPDSYSYLHCFQALAKQGCAELIEELFVDMEAEKIPICPHHFSSLIKAYATNQDHEGAQKTFERQMHSGHPLDVHAYNGMINVYAKKGDIYNARQWFEKMKMSGLGPDAVAYSTLMDAHKNALDIDGAWKLYREILNEIGEADVTTLTSLMYVTAKCKNEGLAWIAYEGLKCCCRKECKENSLYQIAVQAFYQGGNMKNIWEVYERSKQDRSNPTQVFYDFVFYSAFMLGTSADVEKALKIYSESRFQFSFHSYNTMLKICNENLDIKMANEVWDRMLSDGIRPRPINYKSFLRVCFNVMNAEAALEKYTEYQSSGYPMDEEIFRYMINIGKRCNNHHVQYIGCQGLKDMRLRLSNGEMRFLKSYLRQS